MFIGIASFGLALLLALTVLMVSECTHLPPNPSDKATALVATHKDSGGSQPQSQATQQQQKSTGWLGIGTFFEDSKKSIAGAVGAKTGACGNDLAILGEWTAVTNKSRNTMTLSFTDCEEKVTTKNVGFGTYSYSTKGGVLTGRLLSCKPAYLGQVGSTDMANYKIEGSMLTLTSGRQGAFSYKRVGGAANGPVPVNKTESGESSWFPDFSFIHF